MELTTRLRSLTTTWGRDVRFLDFLSWFWGRYDRLPKRNNMAPGKGGLDVSFM